MEAHTPTITFPSEWARRPRQRRLGILRELVRTRRDLAVQRAYAAKSGNSARISIPGSEHTHLLHRPRGF